MIRNTILNQEGDILNNGVFTLTNSQIKPLARLTYPTNKTPHPNGSNPAITQLQSAQQTHLPVPSSTSRIYQMTPREILHNRLRIQLNKRLHTILGDGHCLFRCIAKFVTQEDDHLIIRQQCANYIRPL